jgi:hypothetical protein
MPKLRERFDAANAVRGELIDEAKEVGARLNVLEERFAPHAGSSVMGETDTDLSDEVWTVLLVGCRYSQRRIRLLVDRARAIAEVRCDSSSVSSRC